MARDLTHLTDPQVDEAFKLFEKLIADTGRASGKNPGPAWDSVYERLQDGLDDYRREVARRSRTTAQPVVKQAPKPDEGEGA